MRIAIEDPELSAINFDEVLEIFKQTNKIEELFLFKFLKKKKKNLWGGGETQAPPPPPPPPLPCMKLRLNWTSCLEIKLSREKTATINYFSEECLIIITFIIIIFVVVTRKTILFPFLFQICIFYFHWINY